jgi:Nucleoside-diphosphate-sugar pyrophosphorylase involved in lipopolysaccharide biosynthesis/translation initiation factor 2B, gamma/epsilon subunits (eIF-2Bgamma/eIF-2Bepsilon)
MNDPNLMILAGGVSSRMKRSLLSRVGLDPKLMNEAQSKSKAMLTIGEGKRPFLDYLLHNAREAGYEDVLIVISEKDTSIREYYGAKEMGNEFNGLRISYAVQRIPAGRTKPLGTADAVLQGMNGRQDWQGRKFTVCNGDNLYSRKALLTLLESRYPNAMIDYDREALGFDESRILKFAITQKDDEGFLTAIIEKPTDREVERAKGKNGTIGVSMNIFRLDYNDAIPYIRAVPLHPIREEKELPTAISMMLQQHPRSVYAFPLAERVPDMTSIDDFVTVGDYLSKEFGKFAW